jgi:hypothetical protein
VPEFEAGFLAMVNRPGFILVDKRGKRFINEKGIESHAGLLAVDYYDIHALDYPRIPCYAIFDETAQTAGPISQVSGLGDAGRKYTWSEDNSVEIEKGWIIRGNTLSDLAGKLDIPAEALEETVARWNECVEKGEDPQFKRPMRSEGEERPAYKDFVETILSAPIERPPFYGFALYPCLINTQGGPRRDAEARILDAFDQPIPRLYSAGELGSMWGLIYQGSGNIAECFVFGRIAGKNAAREKPSNY